MGDIHGELQYLHRAIDKYLSRIPGSRLIQLGDFGFAKDWEKLKNREYFNQHDIKIVAGNHENYDYLDEFSHPAYLGDFGLLDSEIFFIRGAMSRDKERRVQGKSWWPQEEISMQAAYDAFDFYAHVKPSIVLSHDCPLVVNHILTGDIEPSRTGQLLQRMLETHEPKAWFFGHHHVSFDRVLGSTRFRCLNIGEVIELLVI